MVYYSSAKLDRTFAALCDPTRRAMLARLSNGEASVSELAAPFKMSLPAASKHVRVLEKAGLVRRRKLGRVHRCRLAAQPLQAADQWLSYYRKFWEQRLESLATYLESETNLEAEV